MENRASFAEVASRRSERAGEARRVVEELGDWSTGGGSLSGRLARSLIAAVERGALAAGTRLPADRVLAGALSLSRGTVVAAYDALVADGVVERRVGSGTYVAAPTLTALPEGREGSGLVARLTDRGDGRGLDADVIDLSLSVLHGADDLPAVTVGTEDLAGFEGDSGYTPWGRRELRRAVAALLEAWGLPTTADQVVITNGAQQAISLAAACWVRPGDGVVVDDPTYPGAPAAFTAAGARLQGVAVEGGGPRAGELAAALAARPALVYLQPTVQSPTSAVLGPARRQALAAVIATARVPLVEDLSLAGLAWRPTPPPLAALTGDHPVAVVGSLSKLLWGGLRLGFVRAPAPVAARFARLKATHDLGASVAGQVLAERWLASADLPAVLHRRRRALLRQGELLVGALADRLPEWQVALPNGGLSLWVRLPVPDAEPFAQVALRHGVAVASAASLSVTGAYADHLRLSFAGPPEDLLLGAERLATAWAAFTAGAPRG